MASLPSWHLAYHRSLCSLHLFLTRDRPVGYGDKVPVTVLGRILATLWMVVGIVIFSILTGIMSSNFSDSARAHRTRTAATAV